MRVLDVPKQGWDQWPLDIYIRVRLPKQTDLSSKVPNDQNGTFVVKMGLDDDMFQDAMWKR